MTRELYQSSKELGDGSFIEFQLRRTYGLEGEPTDKAVFRIGGTLFSREGLPPEITAEVVAELVDSASRCPASCDWNFAR